MAELKPRQLMPAWRIWLVFLAAVVVVLVGVAAYLVAQPTMYSATTVVALRPKGERPAQADVVLLTAPRYVSLATSPYVLNQVAQQVGLDPEELTGGVTVTVEPNTANLAITVTLRNRAATATVANVVADAVVRRAGGDAILAAQVLSRAVEPRGSSGPNQLVTLGAGLVAAVVVGAGAAWLFDRHMRRRARLVRGVASVRPVAVPVGGGAGASGGRGDAGSTGSQREHVVPEDRASSGRGTEYTSNPDAYRDHETTSSEDQAEHTVVGAADHDDDHGSDRDYEAGSGADEYSDPNSDRGEPINPGAESADSDDSVKKDKSSEWWPASR